MADQLLEAMASVLRDKGHLDCFCDYIPSHWDGSTMVSVKANGYGPGKPKNLVSHDSFRGEVIICVPRQGTRNSFADRYGLTLVRMTDDVSANTVGKPFHWVIMPAKTFFPLIAHGPNTTIATFLVDSIRGALKLRGLSDAGRAKLESTEAAATLGASWQTEADYDCAADTAEEGRRHMREHITIERDAKLIAIKKREVKAKTGRLGCEVCDTDFGEYYGSLGEGFCEVHHRKPLGDAGGDVTTSLDDLAVLCSNCHRVIHRSKLTVESLRDQLFPAKK